MNELIEWARSLRDEHRRYAIECTQSRMAVDKRVAEVKAEVYQSLILKISKLIDEGKIK